MDRLLKIIFIIAISGPSIFSQTIKCTVNDTTRNEGVAFCYTKIFNRKTFATCAVTDVNGLFYAKLKMDTFLLMSYYPGFITDTAKIIIKTKDTINIVVYLKPGSSDFSSIVWLRDSLGNSWKFDTYDNRKFDGKKEYHWVKYFTDYNDKKSGYKIGQIIYEGDYKNGVKVGKWTYYKSSGQIKYIKTFKNNR